MIHPYMDGGKVVVGTVVIAVLTGMTAATGFTGWLTLTATDSPGFVAMAATGHAIRSASRRRAHRSLMDENTVKAGIKDMPGRTDRSIPA